jgi:hypothetical protein
VELLNIEVQVNTHKVVQAMLAGMHPDQLIRLIQEICGSMAPSFTQRLVVKLRGDMERTQLKGNNKVGSAIQFVKATLDEEDVELLRALL